MLFRLYSMLYVDYIQTVNLYVGLGQPLIPGSVGSCWMNLLRLPKDGNSDLTVTLLISLVNFVMAVDDAILWHSFSLFVPQTLSSQLNWIWVCSSFLPLSVAVTFSCGCCSAKLQNFCCIVCILFNSLWYIAYPWFPLVTWIYV